MNENQNLNKIAIKKQKWSILNIIFLVMFKIAFSGWIYMIYAYHKTCVIDKILNERDFLIGFIIGLTFVVIVIYSLILTTWIKLLLIAKIQTDNINIIIFLIAIFTFSILAGIVGSIRNLWKNKS